MSSPGRSPASASSSTLIITAPSSPYAYPAHLSKSALSLSSPDVELVHAHVPHHPSSSPSSQIPPPPANMSFASLTAHARAHGHVVTQKESESEHGDNRARPVGLGLGLGHLLGHRLGQGVGQEEEAKMSAKGFVQPHRSHLPRRVKAAVKSTNKNAVVVMTSPQGMNVGNSAAPISISVSQTSPQLGPRVRARGVHPLSETITNAAVKNGDRADAEEEAISQSHVSSTSPQLESTSPSSSISPTTPSPAPSNNLTTHLNYTQNGAQNAYPSAIPTSSPSHAQSVPAEEPNQYAHLHLQMHQRSMESFTLTLPMTGATMDVNMPSHSPAADCSIQMPVTVCSAAVDSLLPLSEPPSSALALPASRSLLPPVHAFPFDDRDAAVGVGAVVPGLGLRLPRRAIKRARGVRGADRAGSGSSTSSSSASDVGGDEVKPAGRDQSGSAREGRGDIDKDLQGPVPISESATLLAATPPVLRSQAQSHSQTVIQTKPTYRVSPTFVSLGTNLMRNLPRRVSKAKAARRTVDVKPSIVGGSRLRAGEHSSSDDGSDGEAGQSRDKEKVEEHRVLSGHQDGHKEEGKEEKVVRVNSEGMYTPVVVPQAAVAPVPATESSAPAEATTPAQEAIQPPIPITTAQRTPPTFKSPNHVSGLGTNLPRRASKKQRVGILTSGAGTPQKGVLRVPLRDKGDSSSSDEDMMGIAPPVPHPSATAAVKEPTTPAAMRTGTLALDLTSAPAPAYSPFPTKVPAAVPTPVRTPAKRATFAPSPLPSPSPLPMPIPYASVFALAGCSYVDDGDENSKDDVLLRDGARVCAGAARLTVGARRTQMSVKARRTHGEHGLEPCHAVQYLGRGIEVAFVDTDISGPGLGDDEKEAEERKTERLRRIVLRVLYDGDASDDEEDENEELEGQENADIPPTSKSTRPQSLVLRLPTASESLTNTLAEVDPELSSCEPGKQATEGLVHGPGSGSGTEQEVKAMLDYAEGQSALSDAQLREAWAWMGEWMGAWMGDGGNTDKEYEDQTKERKVEEEQEQDQNTDEDEIRPSRSRSRSRSANNPFTAQTRTHEPSQMRIRVLAARERKEDALSIALGYLAICRRSIEEEEQKEEKEGNTDADGDEDPEHGCKNEYSDVHLMWMHMVDLGVEDAGEDNMRWRRSRSRSKSRARARSRSQSQRRRRSQSRSGGFVDVVNFDSDNEEYSYRDNSNDEYSEEQEKDLPEGYEDEYVNDYKFEAKLNDGDENGDIDIYADDDGGFDLTLNVVTDTKLSQPHPRSNLYSARALNPTLVPAQSAPSMAKSVVYPYSNLSTKFIKPLTANHAHAHDRQHHRRAPFDEFDDYKHRKYEHDYGVDGVREEWRGVLSYDGLDMVARAVQRFRGALS